jgi:hypothetical protein
MLRRITGRTATGLRLQPLLSSSLLSLSYWDDCTVRLVPQHAATPYLLTLSLAAVEPRATTWGRMSLPALQQNAYPGPGYPGSPASNHGDLVVPGAQSADITKRRADDQRRLRRVKDSREQLKSRTRARAASNGTIESSTTNSTAAGRSYTVANVHNGVIYLR